MRHKLISLTLVLAMLLSLFPVTARGAEAETDAAPLAEPHVTHLTVSWDGGEPVELLGELPTVSLPEGVKPVFTVTFDNAERLDQVFVTSTKDGETKYLEAKPQDGNYVTDDYFDPQDEAYIPGTVSVEYTKKVDAIPVAEKWDSAWDDWGVTGAVAEKISGGAADDDVTVAISNVLDGVSGPVIEASISTFEDETGIGDGVDQLKDWLGYYEDLDQLAHYEFHSTENDHKYIVYQGYPVAENQNYAMIVRDVTGNRYTKMLIKAVAGDTDAVASQLSTINTAGKLFYDYYAISGESAALQEQIDASVTMTAEQKAVAKQKVTDLDRDRKLFSVMTVALPAIITVAGVAGGPPGLVFSALLGGITATAGMFWEHRIGMIEGCDAAEGAFLGGGRGIAITNENISDISPIRQDGRYYLAENIDRSIQIGYRHEFYDDITYYPANVTLDLNGHTCHQVMVTRGGNSSLYVYDSSYHGKPSDCGHINYLSSGEETNVVANNCVLGNYPESGAVLMGPDLQGNAHLKNCVIDKIDFEYWSDRIHNRELRVEDCVVYRGISINSRTDPKIEIKNCAIGQSFNCPSNGSATIVDSSIEEIKNSGTLNINNVNSDFVTNSGTMKIEGGTFGDRLTGVGRIENRGNMSLTDSMVSSLVNESGNLTISGDTTIGSSESSIGLSNSLRLKGGDVIINEGKINGIWCDYASGNDTLSINGGVISGIHFYGNRSNITIREGTISEDGIVGSGTVTLELDGIHGPITIIGRVPQASISVKAASGYTGNVTYYNAPNARGINMTIQQANDIDFGNASYVRLVASDGTTPTPPSASTTPSARPSTAPSTRPSVQPSTSPAPVAVTGVSVAKTARVQVGKTKTLTATVQPSNAANKGVTWTSDDTYVVSVDTNGKITGVKEGAANVTVTTVDGGFTATCAVTVTKAATSGGGGGGSSSGGSSGGGTTAKPSAQPSATPSAKPFDTTKPASENFSDVVKDSWYEDGVTYVVRKGLFQGVADKTFAPQQNMTRAMLVTVLARMDGQSTEGGSTWYQKGADWAKVQGVSDGAMLDQSVTREQMVTMLYRYAKAKAGTTDLSKFADSGEVSDWAKEAMAWAVEQGILTGKDGSRLDPKGTATRAEVSTILQRFVEKN